MENPSRHELFTGRRSGVLLHPTSLPGYRHKGALDENATEFLNFLAESGFGLWQMLPVHPVDPSHSPYQCQSVFAGNLDFISRERLLREPWLGHERFQEPGSRDDTLQRVFRRFNEHAPAEVREAYRGFKRQHDHWLDDFALYSCIKAAHNGSPWWDWPRPLRCRDTEVLSAFRREQRHNLEFVCFGQYVFFSQWLAFREQAGRRRILLLGDVPMFPAHDSADVWANPDYFKIDEDGNSLFVAGVPPDYFSATGQLWGNPPYDWQALAGDGFSWWVRRFHTQLQLFDLLRLDHFRGFEAVWEIPPGHNTAEHGHWVEVPGRRLLQALTGELGPMPFIAEDLGSISRAVIELRDEFRLPGMNVLQFAFDSDADNPYLPHNHRPEDMVCSGTHDNNTTLGWYQGLDEATRSRLREYLQHPLDEMPWPLIHMALESVCHLAVLPMQDLLELDGSHRMNTPGTVSGNWQWGFDWRQLPAGLAGRMRRLNDVYGRL